MNICYRFGACWQVFKCKLPHKIKYLANDSLSVTATLFLLSEICEWRGNTAIYLISYSKMLKMLGNLLAWQKTYEKMKTSRGDYFPEKCSAREITVIHFSRLFHQPLSAIALNTSEADMKRSVCVLISKARNICS